ncbi:MAG: adenylate kinase [Proteobacteria bacterium]|nr:adenylate kinase [Pseudomonadota bacterium]
MYYVLLGAPGVGKGTQASLLSDYLGIPKLSTGDILRKEINTGSAIGISVAKKIESGGLIIDEVVIEIVKNRILLPDCSKGFILDGFPRTIAQSEALYLMLSDHITKYNHKSSIVKDFTVIYLHIENNFLLQRLSGRFLCENCGKVFNEAIDVDVHSKGCVICGGKKFFKRKDDCLDSIKRRLALYQEETTPLIKFYQSKGNLVLIDGIGSVNDVFASIKNIL